MRSRPKLPPVIGHRGAMAYAPENTAASFREAALLGCRWVELDVRLTGDGVPVVIHDATLDRTTSGRGRVATTSYDRIAGLDAGSWFGPEFATERVPTLAQALRQLGELRLGVNIELKPTRGHQRELVATVARVLAARWPATLPALLSSFDRKALAALAELGTLWPRGYLAKKLPRRWHADMRRLGCVSVHLDHRRLTEADAASVKDAGYLLTAYTVDDPKRARELFGWGVDAIFANAPDTILPAAAQ